MEETEIKLRISLRIYGYRNTFIASQKVKFQGSKQLSFLIPANIIQTATNTWTIYIAAFSEKTFPAGCLSQTHQHTS